MSKVAVLGHGVVGSGVAEILRGKKELLKQNTGENIELKYIVDIREFKDSEYSDLFIKDFEIALNDSEINIIVECIGGVKIAYDFVKRALKKGKNVVTSNKELVATHGAELLFIAKEKNINFLFEASVGGGIPVVTPMYQCLCANEIKSVAGILNGTTNFILTKMIEDDMDFSDALELAQKLGYAEQNPAADVDGIDACRKICILASLAFGKHIYPKYVCAKGIRNITKSDVDFAACYNSRIKLIGYAQKAKNGKINIEVSPMLVNKKSQLANVSDVYNAVLVTGDSTDDSLFYGKGAGKLPTASACVADVMECAKANGNIKGLFWDDCKEDNTNDMKNEKFDYYIRFSNSKLANSLSVIENVKMLSSKNNIKQNEYAAIIMDVSEYEIEQITGSLIDENSICLKVFK